MIFKLKENKCYPKYWETKYYAIGVSYETLDKYRVEFLHRIKKDNWQVMGEWTSYEWERIAKLIRTIFDRLKEIDDENPTKVFGSHQHKEIVADFLPEIRQGLLEQ